MKTNFFVIFSVSLLISLSVNSKQIIPAEPAINAKSWILVDASTGTVILENNADLRLPPASLAKMMTTYITSNEIKAGRMKPEDLVTISDNAWRKGGAKTGGSTMFLDPRSKVPVIDLMRGVIIQSGNDASIALAEHISGGEIAFADLMNQQAELLQMTNSEFKNSSGLPEEGMYSSARDLSKIANAIIKDHPTSYKIYSEKYFKHNNINQPNRNRLLWRDKSVDGLKTGRTDEAGFCLVASAEREDMRLISVVLGASNDETRSRESQRLLSYGFRYFNTQTLFKSKEIIKSDVKIWFGTEKFLNLTIDEDAVLTFPRGAEDDLKAEFTIDEVIKAPVKVGDPLGLLKISLENELLLEIPLVSSQNITEGNFISRIIDWLVLFFTNLLS
ncbi:MAG: D-alanyl-D-alanine carboxypeptidase [SAR92 clade bacterium]|uniref:serine-type D-Ala-D-Ala carboxypeptidase n=1 Tax=SAR92 clade bacterium TaxID=2315479 RepID=A0A520LJI3_9GAMM|nr:MAG: D-alanyl-D-alanine carboxypeptidase [SAR92 clade bacterium]